MGDSVALWYIDSAATRRSFEGHFDSVVAIAFSPDGTQLASASADLTVMLWDVDSGRRVGTLRGNLSSVLSLAFDNTGRRLVSGGRDGTVRLWDVRTNEKMDKDRFSEDLGKVEEAYREVARRLGILAENIPADMVHPIRRAAEKA